MVEIELDMNLFGIRRVSKLQLRGRGILDDSDIENLEMKFQDGKLCPSYYEVENVLYSDDLANNDFTVGNYIEADEELSDSLNDSEAIIFGEYKEI